MTNFLTTTDWSPDELDKFLDFAVGLKAGKVSGRLDKKVMGMIFFNSSLRTRMSFESAMFLLGGHAINLTVGQGMWDIENRDGVIMDGSKAEHVREAAPVVSRYANVLGVRSFPEGKSWQDDYEDPVIRGFARHATVPVINMESGVWHPCQAISDALTWKERGIKSGDKIVITWAYHPKALPMAVPNSALAIAAQRGLKATILRPKEFALDERLMAEFKKIAGATGGEVIETDDVAVLEGAKIVYAKSWGSLAAYGSTDEEKKIREKYKDWQVTKEWMGRTADAKFMHCLPVRRNVVVSDEVLDSEMSIVVDQAENRLHAQKALLLKLLTTGGL